MIGWQNNCGLLQLIAICNLLKCTAVIHRNYSHHDEGYPQEADLHHPKKQLPWTSMLMPLLWISLLWERIVLPYHVCFFGFGWHVTVWVYCSTTLLHFCNVSTARGRDPYQEICGLVSTACQHSHVFQLVVDTLAKRPVGMRCQIVLVVWCVNDICTWVNRSGRAESRGSPLLNMFSAAT